MKCKNMGRVTLVSLVSGSLGAMMYLINSLKKNKEKRSGYDVDGYDVYEEVPDDNRSANTTPDSNYYMDAPIKDTPNRIQPGDVSSTVVNTRDYDADMVYSSLNVEIPPNKYMRVSCYEVYDDYENLEDYFE